MFEAREFLRKKLIGQNVHVTLDYIQQANDDFAEKTCCTVTIGGVNVAEALVAKGLATVVRCINNLQLLKKAWHGKSCRTITPRWHCNLRYK